MKSDRQHIKKVKQSKIKTVVVLFILLTFLYFILIQLRTSAFLGKHDRVNIVIYGPTSAFYSFGFADQVNYFISFAADYQVTVPGGYGYYRIGGIGKLVDLEKKPEIYKKIFSSITNSMINYYFYPNQTKIYYGKERKSIFFPGLRQLLFYRSNANLIERLLIIWFFINNQRNFRNLEYLPIDKINEDLIIDQKKINDNLIGNFYWPKLREEKRSVQIVYTKNDNGAIVISRILEGQGVNVADVTIGNNKQSECLIKENSHQQSVTSRLMSVFFNCRRVTSPTAPYDIIFELGELDEDWRVLMEK